MRKRIRVFLFLVAFLLPMAAFGQEVPEVATGWWAWIVANGTVLLEAIGGLVVAAGIIARLTPTNKDDEIVGIVKKFLDYWSPGGINRGLEK